ncbi:MAG: hypothetical protein AAFV53_34540 [Myxococcota bacterium]
MRRLSAGALSDISFQSTSHSDGGLTVAVMDDGDWFQGILTDRDRADDMLQFINEVLETRDAFGRLYSLPAGDDRIVVGYFTDAEADALDAAGLSPDLL